MYLGVRASRAQWGIITPNVPDYSDIMASRPVDWENDDLPRVDVGMPYHQNHIFAHLFGATLLGHVMGAKLRYN